MALSTHFYSFYPYGFYPVHVLIALSFLWCIAFPSLCEVRLEGDADVGLRQHLQLPPSLPKEERGSPPSESRPPSLACMPACESTSPSCRSASVMKEANSSAHCNARQHVTTGTNTRKQSVEEIGGWSSSVIEPSSSKRSNITNITSVKWSQETSIGRSC